MLLDNLLDGMAVDQRESFLAEYQAMRRLPASRRDLQSFLDNYLSHLVRLYAATAGSIWFVTASGEGLSPRARVGIDRLGLSGPYEAPHEALLRYALTRSKSFLVKPFARPARQAGVSNPTDSFVVLGPVDHGGDRIAVVELFLGPTPLRGQTAAERNRYLLWLDHLLTFLCRGIELRLLRSAAPLQAALDRLLAARSELEAMQSTIRDTLQQRLAAFEGWNFGSLERNQAFTTCLHELLDHYGLRVVCPQCGAPSILRCQNRGNAKTGVFLFDHYLESGRTFHGGPTTVPRIQLAAKPARRKSS
jgi:predicted RNA-binding Zn-ribbon protein involved in translation (DUF1610 family)